MIHSKTIATVLIRTYATLVVAIALTGCMRWDYSEAEGGTLPSAPGPGLFIVCEGNFQYGNSSLSFYDPATRTVENNIFYRVNGMKLGDVAQSMSIRGSEGWIAVNNSHVIFIINTETFREIGRIENAGQPRYIHFVDDTKAYVSQLWDSNILIINPQTRKATGTISVPGMEHANGSTEHMIQRGKYVYCNCWSYQDRIIRIDTSTDRVDGSLRVGVQPNSMVMDAGGKLWVITDGGFEGNPAGNENPGLVRIDAENFEIEKSWRFPAGSKPTRLTISGDGETLYWLNGGVWCMSLKVTGAEKSGKLEAVMPTTPIISGENHLFYGLAIDPRSGDIYVSDAIDYQQGGIIYRYDSACNLQDQFYTGVTPATFTWK